MLSLTAVRCFSDPKSTLVTSSYDIFTSSTHTRRTGAPRAGAKIVITTGHDYQFQIYKALYDHCCCRSTRCEKFQSSIRPLRREIIAFWPHHPPARRPWEGAISAKMLYFLVTMVESSSESSHSALNGNIDGCKMLYRSQIDNHGE